MTPRLLKTAALALVGSMFFASANAALIEIWDEDVNVTSLAQSDAVIAGRNADITAIHNSPIDFDDYGDWTTGMSDLNWPWPGGVYDTFVVRITGLYYDYFGGPIKFGVNYDDGMRLSVNGVVVSFGDGVADNRMTWANVDLDPGYNDVELIFFENRGGASLEMWWSYCECGRQNLVTLETPVPVPGTLALFGLGLLGLGVARRRRTA